MIDVILLVIMIPILIAYPFGIAYVIDKFTKKSKDITIKKVAIETLKIILYSIVTVVIICLLIEKYYDLILLAKPKICINSGGFTYSCKGDYRTIIMQLIMGIIITLHHFLSQHSIYKISKFNNKYLIYIFMYIYLIIIYLLNIAFAIFIYGLIASIHYDSVILEIIRLLIAILPSGLFVISTFIYVTKNKH